MGDLHMFDYSFLQSRPPEGAALLLTEVKKSQERLLACRQAYPGIYSALERAGRVRSLLAACGAAGLEGRAAEICARNSPPITDAEKDMSAYRDALFELQLGHPSPTPSCRDLLRLHGILLSRGQQSAGGRYREEETGSPTPPEKITAHMEAWEQAALTACESQPPSLLTVPCLVADFMRIAPFFPGNKRMCHLATLMLLQRAGIALPAPWEELETRYRGLYLQSLRQIDAEGYWPFIQCFLMLLYLCGQQAEMAFALLPGRRMTKKSRVEAVVALRLAPVSKGEICRILPDVSPTTVEAALGELVKSGLVERRGPARTARYAMA